MCYQEIRERYMKLTCAIMFVLVCLPAASFTLRAADPSNDLVFDKPASGFHESLPLGNGRIGAMVFGGVDEERIVLNESSVWSGSTNDDNRTGASAALPEIRRLLGRQECRGRGTREQELHLPGCGLRGGLWCECAVRLLPDAGQLVAAVWGWSEHFGNPVYQRTSRRGLQPGDRVLDRRQRGNEVVHHSRGSAGGLAV